MGTTESPQEVETSSRTFDGPLPEYVDWIASALIAIGGLALTVGGSALTFVVDRGLLAEGIESGEVTVIVIERELTEAQMLDLSLEVANWTGIGLLVTGIALFVFAIAYVISRHRTHQQAGPDRSTGSYRSYAVLGAVATAVLSFIPFSPAAGGGLAGYVGYDETGRPTATGALSGFLAMLPALVVLLFVAVGLYSGFAAVQEAGLGMVTITAMLLGALFVAAYGAGLGALGGFLGGRLAEE